MSMRSFVLSKRGSTWWAAATLPESGRAIEFACGRGTRAAAELEAARVLARKVAMGALSRQRWRQFHERRAAGADPWHPDPELLEAEADPEPDDDRATEDTKPDRPPLPRNQRADDIAAKLRGLGDAQPISPDAVLGPGETDTSDDTSEADGEAGDLVAEAIAVGIVAGHCRLITRDLRKRKPPERPGESADRWLDWEKAGLQLGLEKLLGKAGQLGPVGKCLVGAAGVTISMYWGSEVIEETATAAAVPSSPAAAAAPSSAPTPTNGVHRAPSAAFGEDDGAAIVPSPEVALGRFQ